jgi:pimeloyl-ACP methyl ester carboxylesterase
MMVFLIFLLLTTITLSATAKITSHRIGSADGITLHYEEIGNPDNPTLLLIHDWVFSSVLFTPQFEDRRLVDRFHLVRMDGRGVGRSSKLMNKALYDNIYYHADDIHAVIKDITKPYPKKKLVLVGISYGFPKSLAYVDKYGYDNVAGLVSINGYVNTQTAFPPNATDPIVMGVLSNNYTKALLGLERIVDLSKRGPWDEESRMIFIGE